VVKPHGTATERFWPKVQKTDGCWLWLAGRGNTGYGSFWAGAEQTTAHRFAYELLVGPVPPGLDLDHLCRVRHCVNPAHLEPVTRNENLMRGTSTLIAIAAAKTHCPQGHEYTAKNTYLISGKHRKCRTCQLENMRRYRKRFKNR
jgi:HNH endonuclease